MRPYKRKRILVDTFQYRLLAIDILYFLAILLISAAVHLFSPRMIQWPLLILALVLLATHSVLISHRIAGPLYQFRNIFKLIAQGNLSVRVRIRKTDYLLKDANSINEMITALKTKITGIEEQYGNTQAVLFELKRTIDNGSGQDMYEHIKNLEVQMERLKLCVNEFRTAGLETGVDDTLTGNDGGRVPQALGT